MILRTAEEVYAETEQLIPQFEELLGGILKDIMLLQAGMHLELESPNGVMPHDTLRRVQRIKTGLQDAIGIPVKDRKD